MPTNAVGTVGADVGSVGTDVGSVGIDVGSVGAEVGSGAPDVGSGSADTLYPIPSYTYLYVLRPTYTYLYGHGYGYFADLMGSTVWTEPSCHSGAEGPGAAILALKTLELPFWRYSSTSLFT